MTTLIEQIRVALAFASQCEDPTNRELHVSYANVLHKKLQAEADEVGILIRAQQEEIARVRRGAGEQTKLGATKA